MVLFHCVNMDLTIALSEHQASDSDAKPPPGYALATTSAGSSSTSRNPVPGTVICNADYLDYKKPEPSATESFVDYKRDEPEVPPPKFDEAVAKEAAQEALMPPPPPFSTYVSKMRMRGDTHVISHDPHLNEDGEYFPRHTLLASIQPFLL